uniref:Uncharacterized protein n=1 Tax=Stegastes partitus TaxID=144197 RepID=A0A3B5BLH6_9TELE
MRREIKDFLSKTESQVVPAPKERRTKIGKWTGQRKKKTKEKMADEQKHKIKQEQQSCALLSAVVQVGLSPGIVSNPRGVLLSFVAALFPRIGFYKKKLSHFPKDRQEVKFTAGKTEGTFLDRNPKGLKSGFSVSTKAVT